ncbi:MAG TPA: anti-sigma factor [Pseudonocardiaceae bacterium]|nr:anti-sigma factor [Pseudonocardiaceae bacterium]
MSIENTTRDGHRVAGATVVEVRVSTDLSQLFVLRSLMAAIAVREDFDLDQVDDIKLAVDEMCSALMLRGREGGLLTCRFESTDGAVAVLASVEAEQCRPIDQDNFGWQVLTILADEVTTWITPGLDAPYEVRVRLTKARSR